MASWSDFGCSNVVMWSVQCNAEMAAAGGIGRTQPSGLSPHTKH